MTILYADELAAEARERGESYKEAREYVQTKALSQHPLYLGMITSVNYDSKTDRYVVKFDGGTVKATNDVAKFLLTEVFNPMQQARPVVYAHMNQEGAVSSVLLLFVSRQ
jgi:hypothetical protein